MPELPDVTVYVDRLSDLLVDVPCLRVDVRSLFVLRTVEPSPGEAVGRRMVGVERLGKRVILEFEDDLFFVIHLMIAGRLRWRTGGKKVSGKMALMEMEFPSGVLWLTEASAKKRASLHVVSGRPALEPFDRGGMEVLDAALADFRDRLQAGNHTVKRALTDPRIFSGIGNAYSDEILHAACLSPLKWTTRLSDDEVERLWDATKSTLSVWIERLRREVGDGFPEKVTAFHAEMAVHGKYREPCPRCQSEVQRIRYASNECNYCPTCQTGGKLLADRGLSQLHRGDWPKTLEELEERRSR